MKCSNCGNESSGRFCPNCGTPLESNNCEYSSLNYSSTINKPPCNNDKKFATASLICGIIGFLSFWLIIGVPFAIAGLILGIIALIKKTPKKGMAIAGTVLSGVSVFLFAVLIIIIIAFGEVSDTDAQDTPSAKVEKSITNNSNESKQKQNNNTNKPTDNASKATNRTSNQSTISELQKMTDEQFKKSCEEVIYNNLNNDWIGKHVTKEILFGSVEGNKYQCASTEDYIEDYLEYQHSYRIYDIFDHRLDKSFPIQSNDVIQIYGIVTDIQMNYANGLYYPIIDMYYIDYIRKWREPIEDSKTIDEIIQERNAESEQTKAENGYFNSLNSDYAGQTKNISNMELLSEEDFKSHCDSMNFKDMVDSTEDLTNRYVKIHLQLTSHRTFISEDAKRRRLNDLIDIYDINDNLWYSNMFYEQTGEYVTNPILLYFADNNTYNPNTLTKNQELTVYGLVLNYKINEGYHNSFDFLVVYTE